MGRHDLDALLCRVPVGRRWAAFLMALVLGGLALVVVGCQQPVVYVPAPPVAPPVQPPPYTPPVGPPATPPVAPPAPVADILARLTVGMTLDEATAVMGTPARVVPAGEATPTTARWDVTDPGGQTWMVYVVLDGTNRVSGKGAAKVERVP